MSVQAGHTDPSIGVDPHPTSTPNWTINVSDIRTIRVNNVSVAASKKDIKDFFSFSGDIQFVELQWETETTQVAYVTFKESQGADTAMLFSGAMVADLPISITPVENYQLPPDAPPLSPVTKPTSSSSAVKKTEEVVSTVLATGLVLGKDALNKAKSFDERHHLTSNASATVASINRKIGLADKLSTGTAVVNGKVRNMDERFQVSEITKSAFSAAEQKASSAGSAIMSNRYVSTGASWVSSAFSVFVKAAEDVSSMTKEKLDKAEEERKEAIYKVNNGYGNFQLDKSSVGELPVVTVHSADHDSKLGMI